ncbi:MAG: ribosome assembly protein 4 [Nostoc indistinguendum CM1-VF10]|jgi:WD40 repeat protein/tetratricopeptide (TPR) repeat protein|nr:ribosome assembly protein 4 [Nostoc indistinguendum CM1-VF10]
MSTQRQSDELTPNERSLQQLAWTLQASVGKFKLIWARCNYSDLRTRLIERLGEICKIKIQVLQLKESERTLYTAIRSELQPDTQALMIVGWESLQDLPQMLTSANQVREEFRKNLSLPVVVWISEEIHHTIMEIAPDLESWGTSRSFVIAPADLSKFIKQLADEYFSGKFSIKDYSILELELEAAQRDILAGSPEIEANLGSLLGLVKQVNNKIDEALEYYQKARLLWQQLNSSEKQVKILGEIAYCYYLKAFKSKDTSHPDWQATRQYTQEYITFLNRANRQDLAASSIAKFGNILRDLKEWEQLKNLAEQALQLHEANNQLIELALDYGFLAQVALAQSRWSEAKELAQKAKDILPVTSSVEIKDNSEVVSELAKEPTIPYDLSLYYFILAQAEYELGEPQQAIANLEVARDASNPVKDLQLHLDILSYLQILYFEKKEYLKAYETKQQQRSIEQQFGLRAFIGAGRLQSTKQALVATTKTETQENIAPEIAASGRLLDIERLVERLGRHDHKLIVIHGQSGVGKSSLVNAGLVPALKNKSVGIQDYLPVAMRVYTNWVEELGRALQQALYERGKIGDQQAFKFEVSALVDQLHENEQHNFRTVLIFDQFEEFFFAYTQETHRQHFFEFLGECLNILSVKVILSLRVDYLHYLLECNRLPSMTIIGKDILSSNVLYELGNFTLEDTESIIQRLTQTANFELEPALIEQLVQDLAQGLGKVRPIELQIVGAQLQTENIATLAEYQQRGTKEELVKRYLAEVVNNCGVENQQIAEFLLYLLTDEKGTRPLKTRVEIELELQALAAEIATDSNDLDLVLEILVKSGLVILLPENLADRYQLVHDYIAVLVRQQQEPKLNQLMAQLEQEKQQRRLSEEQRKLGEAKLNSFLKRALFGSVAAGVVLAVLAVTAFFQTQQAKEQRNKAENERNQATISEINALTNSSQAHLISGEYIDAIVEALKASEKLPSWASNNIQMKTVTTLQQAVYLQPKENPANRAIELNTLEGHTNAVWSVMYSPDGKTIASGSDDNTIKIWDVTTGKAIKTLTGHTSRVDSVVYSPDGRTLASGSADKTIKIWDITTGQAIKTLTGHSSYVRSVVYSPDGRTLASGSDDKTSKIWDITTGQAIKTLTGHTSRVDSVVYSPDGKTLASGSWDKTIKIWDVITGKAIKTLTEHTNWVNSIVYSPDGKTLASSSLDNTIKIWDITTGKGIKTLTEQTDTFTVTETVRSAVYSPDGKTLASVSADNIIKIWDITTGKAIKTLTGHIETINNVVYSPDGGTLASVSADSTIKIWDTTTGKAVRTLSGHTGGVNSVVCSPDGRTLASGSDDNTIKIWDITTGKAIKTLTGHTETVNNVVYNPDGKTLASGSDDNTIKIWDITTSKAIKTLTGHTSRVNSVVYSPDGKTLASGSDDNTIKIWDIITGKAIKTLTEQTDNVTETVRSVVYSPDGKTLASGSWYDTIKIWDITTGKAIKTIVAHSKTVNSVVYSPDGKTLASGSWDNTIKIWDINRGKLIKTLTGHTGGVNSVVYSPDGRTLASGSNDNTIKIWDIITGKAIKTLTGHTEIVNNVVYNPDGKTLASGSDDKTVILWTLDLNKLVKDGCNLLAPYLITHPETLAELKKCQTKSLLVQAASVLLIQGEKLAQNDDLNAAIDKFSKAQGWDTSLHFNPQIKVQELANKAQAKRAVDQGGSFVNEGKVKEALDNYALAQKLDPKVEISADSWDLLCWYGSLYKQAADIMFACNKAVALSADDRRIKDSRGLARALTGDTKGAIADFDAYIVHIDKEIRFSDEYELKSLKKTKAQRQRWVKELRAGKNPFTDAELEKLRGE